MEKLENLVPCVDFFTAAISNQYEDGKVTIIKTNIEADFLRFLLKHKNNILLYCVYSYYNDICGLNFTKEYKYNNNEKYCINEVEEDYTIINEL